MKYCLLALTCLAAGGAVCAQPVGISYVQGTGQMGDQIVSVVPIVVLVYDANRKPVANSPVTFTVTQGGPVGFGPPVSTVWSDANGLAISYSPAYAVDPSQSFQLVEVDAMGVAGNAIKFLFTSLSTAPTFQVLEPTDPNDVVVNATAGALLKGAYQVIVLASGGPQALQPIPNVGLRATNQPYLYNAASGEISLSPPDPRLPSAACINNTLSDSTGLAVCDLQIGPRTGTVQLYMAVGEYKFLPVITLHVAPGPPAQISIAGSGPGQSGQPGQTLPLQVQVTDSSGNPTPNVPVAWTLGIGSATLASTSTVTDAKGLASNSVTLGMAPGPVEVRALISPSTYVNFNLISAQVVSGLQVVSGDNQSAIEGAAFPNPLVVRTVDLNGVAVAGIPVAFSISGGASLSASTVTTDAFGMASVTATAGPNPGTVTATASALGFEAVFANLTVLMPGPELSATGIRNAASGQSGLTPCGLASLTGTGLAPGVSGTMRSTDPAATTLGPVDQVLIAGVAAPVVSVANNGVKERVVVQTPCGTPVGEAEVDVSVLGQTVIVPGVEVDGLQPGVFSVSDGAGDGMRIVWAIHPDGSAVSLTSPAARGETIRIFATGLGPLAPPAAPDSAAQLDLTTRLILGIDNAGVPMIGSGYIVSQPGVYFVDVAIPPNLVTGEISAAFVIGADASGMGTNLIYSNTVNVPIR